MYATDLPVPFRNADFDAHDKDLKKLVIFILQLILKRNQELHCSSKRTSSKSECIAVDPHGIDRSKPGKWKRKQFFFCGSGSAKNLPLPLPHRREEWREKRNWFCCPSEKSE